jgi:hypothetical protein
VAGRSVEGPERPSLQVVTEEGKRNALDDGELGLLIRIGPQVRRSDQPEQEFRTRRMSEVGRGCGHDHVIVTDRR